MHSLTAWSLLENSFIDFRISTRVVAHFFQTNLFLKSSLLHFQKGCLICLRILSSWSYPRSNNPKDYCLVILEATGLFLDAALRYGFFQKILNKITDMARYNILNEDCGRPEPFCLSMVPNASNLFINCFTEVLSHCFSRLFFHIFYFA